MPLYSTQTPADRYHWENLSTFGRILQLVKLLELRGNFNFTDTASGNLCPEPFDDPR